jgi:hypothetical protein
MARLGMVQRLAVLAAVAAAYFSVIEVFHLSPPGVREKAGV